MAVTAAENAAKAHRAIRTAGTLKTHLVIGFMNTHDIYMHLL
jgi:hypothetical protein